MESKFLTELSTKCVDNLAMGGRGIWKITDPLVYCSEILGRVITVEAGFLTDYASVPRVPIAYLLLGDTCHTESVIHDWLYHHHEICDEQTANRVLLEASKAIRSPAWRRSLMYLGVAIGGRSSWEEDGRGDGHSIINGRIV
ncbi:MAG: DUF1353 domain-containing protein [Candidimonas sp.]|nr:MAG: DUF1353 domain-containing protein [Candidimonas sp.]TAM26796.1 MAG: DUF1353 domain-containing protein [Candidimonas sp.]TAM79267.1 MAG: DUF1353 domain-containing protein [Candidimonas sp.]